MTHPDSHPASARFDTAFVPAVANDLLALPAGTREKVLSRLVRLEANPAPEWVEAVNPPCLFRFVAQGVRVTYSVDDSRKRIVVVEVRPAVALN